MRPLPIASLLFLALGLLAPACGGGGLKYKIDDSSMDAIAAGDRQGVFAAQNEMEVAKSESRNAASQLETLGHDEDVAKAEKQQAELEVEKAIAETESAVQSRNENQANAAKHNKNAADIGVQAADQKLAWLDEKEEWLKALRDAADAHVAAASAKVEYEKAKVAQAKGIKPDGDFAVANYADQYEEKKNDWESAKRKASSEEKDAKDAESKWKELVQQQQKMK